MLLDRSGSMVSLAGTSRRRWFVAKPGGLVFFLFCSLKDPQERREPATWESIVVM